MQAQPTQKSLENRYENKSELFNIIIGSIIHYYVRQIQNI